MATKKAAHRTIATELAAAEAQAQGVWEELCRQFAMPKQPTTVMQRNQIDRLWSDYKICLGYCDGLKQATKLAPSAK